MSKNMKEGGVIRVVTLHKSRKEMERSCKHMTGVEINSQFLSRIVNC